MKADKPMFFALGKQGGRLQVFFYQLDPYTQPGPSCLSIASWALGPLGRQSGLATNVSSLSNSTAMVLAGIWSTIGMRMNQIIVGDCIEIMKDMPEACADLIFADPPFNIGYKYDIYNDRRSRDEYLEWAEQWIKLAVRLLKRTGSFWLAIGDEYVAEYKIRLDSMGLTMRNWIIWHYTFGVSCNKKFSRSHTHILYYVYDPKQYTFNADAIRVPSARLTTYADRRANPQGKVPDDTWILRPQETTQHFHPEQDVWYFPRICGTFQERLRHPCQMPEAILERIIQVATHPGDLVVDPFAGSGTTLAVAKRLGRRYWGCELSEAYADLIAQRLQMLDFEPTSSPGKLRTRSRRAQAA